MFNDLISIAKETLAKTNEVKEGYPEPQAIVFTTQNSYTYISVVETPQEICSRLVSEDDTRILKILVMWKNGEIDVPSYELRKAIVELNNENMDAHILLQGEDGLLIKKLSEMMA